MNQPPSTSGDDRRSRGGLRALIDEMMTQLRAASNQDVWTPEARARAEADLERIMSTVRQQALGEQGQEGEPASPGEDSPAAKR